MHCPYEKLLGHKRVKLWLGKKLETEMTSIKVLNFTHEQKYIRFSAILAFHSKFSFGQFAPATAYARLKLDEFVTSQKKRPDLTNSDNTDYNYL